jgi:hypothetical protein
MQKERKPDVCSVANWKPSNPSRGSASSVSGIPNATAASARIVD